MRIDAHQHFWRYSATALPWIGEGMEVLRRDFLPADLKPILDAAGVDGCVAVQAQQDVSETQWLLDLATADPWILGVVGWVDLSVTDVSQSLVALAHPRLCGIRHLVQDEPDDDFLRRPAFRRGLQELASRGLTFDLLLFPRHLEAAAQTVAAIPELRFVLDHLAKPTFRERSGVDPFWESGIRRLASYPNVACKLSGMVTEADWEQADWDPSQFVAHVDVVVDAFGADRLLLGSDWPVCLLARPYDQVHRLTMTLLERHGLHLDAGILGGNAQRWYRLEGDTP